MDVRIAIVYNEPEPSRYDSCGEGKAVSGVIEAVASVRRSLEENGWKVIPVALLPPWSKAEKRLSELDVEIVFNLFEGFCGEPETEPLVADYLEKSGITLTGCSAATLRLALDKSSTKRLMHKKGIVTPDFQLLKPGNLTGFRLKFPCIVKPRCEDASHGITEASVVSDLPSLCKQVEIISDRFGNPVLVEEFVKGREFNATILGNSTPSVLPISEIAYELGPELPPLLTYAAKWEPVSEYYQKTKVVCPAIISPELQTILTHTALEAFRALDCFGYARVDMRLGDTGRPQVIDVNPNPDISPGAGAARQAEAASFSYNRFVEKIIRLALEKKRDGHQSTQYERRR